MAMLQRLIFNHQQSLLEIGRVEQARLLFLQEIQLLPEFRAIFFPSNTFNGIKNALLIHLNKAIGLPSVLDNYHWLWLVQLENGKMFCYGNKKQERPTLISGTSLNNLQILQHSSNIVDVMSNAFASAVYNRMKSRKIRTDKNYLMLLLQVEKHLLTSAINTFVKQLDNDVLEALNLEGVGHHSIYNYYITGNDIVKRNRLQAISSFTWLGGCLRNEWKIRSRIDQGQALGKFLPNYLQLKKSTIKQSNNLSCVGISEQRKYHLLRWINRFSREYHPSTNEDLEVFDHLIEPLNDLSQTIGTDINALIKPFKNGWHSGLLKLQKNLQFKVELSEIFEMMLSSYHHGVCYEISNLNQSSIPDPKWYHIWFGHYNLNILLKMTVRWKKAMATFCLMRLVANPKPKHEQGMQWPVLEKKQYSLDQIRIVELTSQHELEAEGHRLKHCLASYAENCLFAGSYIYSIRNHMGISMSTFEVGFTQQKAKLIQHKATENVVPSEYEQNIVKQFIDNELSSVNPLKVESIVQQRRKLGQQIKEYLPEPNTTDGRLNKKESKQLAKLVEYTHPSVAIKESISSYYHQHLGKNKR
jgi:hypothetical protein